jgi:hypothetical protein
MNNLRIFLRFLLDWLRGKMNANPKPAKPAEGASANEKATTLTAPLEDTTTEPKPEPVPEPEPEETPQPMEPLQPLPVIVQEVVHSNRQQIVVSSGNLEAAFRPFRRGLYTVGRQKAADFIAAHREDLEALQLSPSAINIMLPVSENEGNLDAINTWDNSFMTFGMFQWTIGASEDEGELPALLKKIKQADEGVFHEYFQLYGLDVSENTGEVYGYLTRDGQLVKSVASKNTFRSPEWAFRFWHAGQDPKVMATEIEHAVSRLKTFYWKNSHRVNGHLIADLITSEYGVALILDNHVNRPGYVRPCLERALRQTGLSHPERWTTQEEETLLEAYLTIRETFGSSPMTHAAQRAAKVRDFRRRGILSGERGSFIIDPHLAGRGGDPRDLIGIPPYDYQEALFDDILPFEEHQDLYLEREAGLAELLPQE